MADPDPHKSPSEIQEIQARTTSCKYLIKCPSALQWFDGRTLQKRLTGERQASRFELFLDLLYVALVANFSENLAEDPTGASLVTYVLIFWPAWHIWADLRELMNSYYTDDLVQRGVVLWVMALLVLYGNNAAKISGDEEGLKALRTAVGSYVLARGTAAACFAVCSFASFHHRAQARLMAAAMGVGCCLCVPLFLGGVSLRAKVAVVVVVLVWHEVTWGLILSPYLKRKLKLRYSTAVDLAHEIDRLAAFYIIVLGEFLYSIVVASPAGVGLTAGYGNAVCTLIIAFCLNWLYTSGDGSIICEHPIRRSASTAFAWFFLHIPLSASLLAGGHVAAVTAQHSFEFEKPGQPWLLGAGLGIGMMCLWVLAMLHREDPGSPKMIMSKNLRVAMRPVVATVLILLPLAHWRISGEGHGETHAARAEASLSAESSTSSGGLAVTNMMIISMALIGFAVIWETVGGAVNGAHLIEPWEFRHPPQDGDDEALVN